MRSGIRFENEVQLGSVLRDSAPLGTKIARALRKGDNAAVGILAFAGAGFVFPAISEIAFCAGLMLGAASYGIQRKTGLPMRVPKSANKYDPAEIHPATKKGQTGEGIFYLGVDRDTGEEVWETDTQARTHWLFMGTTGSGKTEYLISAAAFNALVHGSGFIYVDGKADNSLYGKIYSMARFMGREDDVLLINFQTGAKDVFGPQPKKMSNTLNPFAVGSSGMLSQLVIGLMSGGEGGKQDVWSERAISFVEALLKPLVYLRDHYGLLLDVEVTRNYFPIEPLVALITDNMQKERNRFGADVWVERADAKHPGIGPALSGLIAYIDNLPGFNWSKPVSKQESVVSEQHGYITMQLVRTFNSLADTYGYIMKTPLAEIDFLDVFINRRILVVLLPALEKSPQELTNLGRIVVASIKATMAVGLGADVEGDWKDIIDAKPSSAHSPFPAVFDEYGYYAVNGFAVVPAQARSLGFSAIFAGQDLPAFEKASKEEAASTLGNTTSKFCGKLECTKTYELFKSVASEGYYTKMGGFNNQANTVLSQNYMDNQHANVERIARVSYDDLRDQISGEWHLFYGDRIVRVQSFYANPPKVKKLRTNHFVQIAPPSDQQVRYVKRVISGFGALVLGDDEPAALSDIGSPYGYEIAGFESVFKSVQEGSGQVGFDLGVSVCRKLYEEELAATASFENDTMSMVGDVFSDASFDDKVLIDEGEDALFGAELPSKPLDFADAVTDDDDDLIFGAIGDDEGIGLLSAERTQKGIAEIEQKLGRSESVSEVLSSEVAHEMSSATIYPDMMPGEEPDIDDFIEIASKLESGLKSAINEREGDDGSS